MTKKYLILNVKETKVVTTLVEKRSSENYLSLFSKTYDFFETNKDNYSVEESITNQWSNKVYRDINTEFENIIFKTIVIFNNSKIIVNTSEIKMSLNEYQQNIHFIKQNYKELLKQKHPFWKLLKLELLNVNKTNTEVKILFYYELINENYLMKFKSELLENQIKINTIVPILDSIKENFKYETLNNIYYWNIQANKIVLYEFKAKTLFDVKTINFGSLEILTKISKTLDVDVNYLEQFCNKHFTLSENETFSSDWLLASKSKQVLKSQANKTIAIALLKLVRYCEKNLNIDKNLNSEFGLKLIGTFANNGYVLKLIKLYLAKKYKGFELINSFINILGLNNTDFLVENGAIYNYEKFNLSDNDFFTNSTEISSEKLHKNSKSKKLNNIIFFANSLARKIIYKGVKNGK